MITMELKGITWVGNIYQKFENMCLEAEEVIYEDTVKYLENQVQTVGESVKKFYADVMQDLLPPSCDLDERGMSDFPIDQDTNVEVHKKKIMGPKERTTKVDIKQIRKDLRINDVDKDVTCATSYENSCDTNFLLTPAPGNSIKVNKFNSHARRRVRSTNIGSNLAPTWTVDGNTAAKTEIETCKTLSSNILNENLEVPFRSPATVSNQSLAEVKIPDLISDFCCEKESSEDIPDLSIFDNKPADEKEVNVSPSYSAVQSGELSDGWNFKLDFMIEKDPEAMGKFDDELKLDQSCVMVSGDELRLIPMAGGNPKINKKKMRRVFSLGKKCGRKQEYEQLAAWHGKREKGEGDCVEDSEAVCAEGNNKKPTLPNISESEWEVL